MPLVELLNINKSYRRGDGSTVHAAKNVSFAIEEGETLAIIGESGSGKSTIGRLLLRLFDSDSGEIWFDGKDIALLNERQMRPYRAQMQLVFQEPLECLNPRMRIGAIVAEPLVVQMPDLARADRDRRVLNALADVGLSRAHADRLPREMSGGQLQRVGIARALITTPRLVVLDEPTSSLDVTVQAQILELLKELQKRHRVSYLYISHDLSTVEYIAHKTAVMRSGEIVEIGETGQVANNPVHEYSRLLKAAFLSPER